MNIAGRIVGPDSPPYLIAEIGASHGGSLTHALELIDAAKASGADAVKFQAYEADTITIDSTLPPFAIADGPWRGRNLYNLYRQTETPFHWFPAIKARAERVGITWFASCFDKTSIDLMVRLGAPAIKIASFEITDIPLIEYAAATGRQLIISTGMASIDEIARASNLKNGPALLHCVSGYPSEISEANLGRLKYLEKVFRYPVGISDHTLGVEVPVAATALGATIIEKHFRLSWHPETEDSPFSLDEVDFHAMAKSVCLIWQGLRPPAAVTSETAHRTLRRSLFAVADVKAGDLLTEQSVRSIRPGHGLPPAEIERVIGRRASRDIQRGEPMSWDMVAA